jgi:hypothetical protein
MKPKAPSEHEDGLLEYLEDIIGTSKYKAPIEECNEEVEKLNEDRGARLTRLRHVEKEKSRLEVCFPFTSGYAPPSDFYIPWNLGSQERGGRCFKGSECAR